MDFEPNQQLKFLFLYQVILAKIIMLKPKQAPSSLLYVCEKKIKISNCWRLSLIILAYNKLAYDYNAHFLDLLHYR